MKRSEPLKGEHLRDAIGGELSPWVAENPLWPKGSGPYMRLCVGCPACDPSDPQPVEAYLAGIMLGG